MNASRDVLGLALRTAELLGPVFPCAPRSKEPFARLAPHGCYSATRDPETIRSWFRPGSTLNLALACGGGLFALDVDPRNDGDEALARLEREHGPLPMTPRQITGGAGLHYLLRSGVRLRNGAVASGLEIKADGGYIVIAPSVHPSGGTYRWDLGALPSETPVADAPAWLLDLAREHELRDYGAAAGPAAESFVGIAFAAAQMLGHKTGARGATAARCPWFAEHSDGRGDGCDLSTVVLPATQATKLGAFRCAHAHCSSRRTRTAVAVLPTSAIIAAARALPDLAPLVVRWIDEPGNTRP
jgi:Bifunctional DNA primase/polymerase, N-terminal